MSQRSIEEIRKDAWLFSGCKDIAEMQYRMQIDSNELLLYSLHPKYYRFTVRKPSGGEREIETPIAPLKEIQRRLNHYIQAWYYEHQPDSSYGYIISPKKKKNFKNIVKNAERHLGNDFMMQIDFEDFFHQIKTTDVYGIFNSGYFNFSEKASCTLAKVCTYNNRLPMGAPTSPALSNIYTIGLDREIESWAAGEGIVYSRFVDDLTFSSKEKPVTDKQFTDVQKICRKFRLEPNPKKTRFLGPGDRKVVTGLVLDKTVDIPQTFYESLDKDLVRLKNIFEVTVLLSHFEENPLLKKFKQEVQGQVNFIGMVEGYHSPVFTSYIEKYQQALEADDELFEMRWTHFGYL